MVAFFIIGRVDMRHELEPERRPIAVPPLCVRPGEDSPQGADARRRRRRGRAGGGKRLDGPAARAPAARATKATSDLCARVIAASAVARNARLSPTQTRLTHLLKKQNCQNEYAITYQSKRVTAGPILARRERSITILAQQAA